MSKFKEYTGLRLPEIHKTVLAKWKEANVFNKSILSRNENPCFTFYEGPPSANGMPGIHHVIARTIKDLFCRYKTLKGFQVNRKAGWDTHGLPVELGVEKELGISALVDAAGIIGIFDGIVKVADATGIPLEKDKSIASQEIRLSLGIDKFHPDKN